MSTSSSSLDDPRLLLLSPLDNVFVARENLAAGATLTIASAPLTLATAIARGHKIARRAIEAGEKILKYGAPIGSATQSIAAGSHVHVHNVKSDYTATHVIDRAQKGNAP
jgi:hypothetical protein